MSFSRLNHGACSYCPPHRRQPGVVIEGESGTREFLCLRHLLQASRERLFGFTASDAETALRSALNWPQ